MIGPSRSPPPVLATEGPREDTPPTVATDVSADPRQPKSQLSTPSPRLGTPEKEPACIPFPQLTGHPCRNNEVRSVMLYGIPIVSLVIDQQERLCLAQISNTLLKDFSYNEIHNRRVALGITCVQCTPVQLELLRRAGAMPVSSRRCGMITKREAERLCKSFLVDTCPPKLPDNFAFDVYHQCAWGCRGSFVPSRYNSSRAKCIKCAYCGLFFSPNKFIFHSHRLPDSKYVQPDAANFNSWRRHIRLSGTPPEEVAFAWEDVKAMFNGGSRKRVMASSISSFSRNHHELKRSRLSSSSSIDLPTSSATSSSAPKQSLFPLVPLPNKTFSLPSSPPLIPPPAPFSLTGKPVSPTDIRQNFAEYMWAGKHPFPVPYGAVLWPRPPGMTPPVVDAEARSPESNSSGQSSSYRALEAVHRPLSSSSDGGASCSILTEREEEVGEVIHPSAFRPVGRSLNRLQMERPADSNPDTTTSGDVERFDNEEGPEGSESDQDEVDVTDISNDSSSDKLRRSINVDLQEKRDDSPIVDAIQSKKFSGHRQTETASPTSTEGERFASSSSFDVPKLSGLSKEELHEVLLQESQARRKAEVEYQLMRETFEVQVRKEIAYREEIAKQLQLVRDSLCQELDQERKARFAIQQRLKEAHDTLQHFSCKLLNTRHCSDCTLKPMLPE